MYIIPKINIYTDKFYQHFDPLTILNNILISFMLLKYIPDNAFINVVVLTLSKVGEQKQRL